MTNLLSRIAAAEAQAFKRYGEWQQFGPLVSVFAGADLPLSVTWHDGSRPPSAEELAASEDFLRQHGKQAEVHVLSHAAPELLPLLSERGYSLLYVLHLYTHDLKNVPASRGTIQPTADADAWATLSAQGFDCPPAIMQAVARAPGTQLFSALDGDNLNGGEVAGTAAMSVVDGVAALHGTSTLPRFRGRGVQAALLAHRVALAKAQGAELATVFVTPGTPSERNIRRAGFVLTGMRLTFSKPEEA